MTEPKPRKPRTHGDGLGSLYRRRSDRRWTGAITIDGKRLRVYSARWAMLLTSVVILTTACSTGKSPRSATPDGNTVLPPSKRTPNIGSQPASGGPFQLKWSEVYASATAEEVYHQSNPGVSTSSAAQPCHDAQAMLNDGRLNDAPAAEVLTVIRDCRDLGFPISPPQ
jgi:hypothetical protein